MTRGGVLVLLLLSARPATAGAFEGGVRPSGPPAVVTLAWEYRGIPEGMTVYEPGPGAKRLPLWRTASAARWEDVPAGAEVPGGAVKLQPGGRKRLLLVYRNPGKTPVRFFASPHHVHPDESALGFEFACLCMNHVYSAPAGGYWWRVVELQLGEDFSAPTLEVRHALVAPGRKAALAPGP